MKLTLERYLGRPIRFPAEITLSSGEKYLLPNNDHAHTHHRTGELIIYPDQGPFSLILRADEIISVEPATSTPPWH